MSEIIIKNNNFNAKYFLLYTGCFTDGQTNLQDSRGTQLTQNNLGMKGREDYSCELRLKKNRESEQKQQHIKRMENVLFKSYTTEYV